MSRSETVRTVQELRYNVSSFDGHCAGTLTPASLLSEPVAETGDFAQPDGAFDQRHAETTEPLAGAQRRLAAKTQPVPVPRGR